MSSKKPLIRERQPPVLLQARTGWAHRWPDGFSETGQDHSVDTVSLRQLSGGFGEVSDLARINRDNGKLGTGQSTHDVTFETAGCCAIPSCMPAYARCFYFAKTARNMPTHNGLNCRVDMEIPPHYSA